MASHTPNNPIYIHIGLDQPALYEIKIQGRVDTSPLLDWFQGQVLCSNGPAAGEAVTIITGQVLDQAALHGLLNRIRDLGLPLLYVDCLSAHAGRENMQDESSDFYGGSNE